LNSSGIAHTSNHFYSAFHALKGVFSLRQGANKSMDVFYKRFESTIATTTLAGCNTVVHDGLVKYADSATDA